MFQGISLVVILVLLVVVIALFLRSRRDAARYRNEREHENSFVEVNKSQLEALAGFVRASKEETERAEQEKSIKKAEMKQKLETYRQTREELKESLKRQLGRKSWASVEQILRTTDKGSVGIYVLYNETKNKYYVGQAKQVYKRIKEHFSIEDIALDHLNGNRIYVKVLDACELDSAYRLDHIEKTGIEIFDADRSGYNKTRGNL